MDLSGRVTFALNKIEMIRSKLKNSTKMENSAQVEKSEKIENSKIRKKLKLGVWRQSGPTLTLET